MSQNTRPASLPGWYTASPQPSWQHAPVQPSWHHAAHAPMQTYNPAAVQTNWNNTPLQACRTTPTNFGPYFSAFQPLQQPSDQTSAATAGYAPHPGLCYQQYYQPAAHHLNHAAWYPPSLPSQLPVNTPPPHPSSTSSSCMKSSSPPEPTSPSDNNDSGINLSTDSLLSPSGSSDVISADKLYVSSGRRVRKRPLESGKPPYSYIALICMAISNHPDKQATLREIIAYIETRFSFYQRHQKWHGTIRHNLSINDCFLKGGKRPDDKGCMWRIDPECEGMFDNGSLLRRTTRCTRRLKSADGSAKRPKRNANKAQQTPTSSQESTTGNSYDSTLAGVKPLSEFGGAIFEQNSSVF